MKNYIDIFQRRQYVATAYTYSDTIQFNISQSVKS